MEIIIRPISFLLIEKNLYEKLTVSNKFFINTLLNLIYSNQYKIVIIRKNPYYKILEWETNNAAKLAIKEKTSTKKLIKATTDPKFYLPSQNPLRNFFIQKVFITVFQNPSKKNSHSKMIS
jgi:hypothetical protein